MTYNYKKKGGFYEKYEKNNDIVSYRRTIYYR
jgi:hypothetical protein